jgi:hypothetical protein
MAWLAMIGGLTFPLLVLFTSSEQVSTLAGAFYTFVGMVVGAYVGFATWDDKNFKDKE